MWHNIINVIQNIGTVRIEVKYVIAILVSSALSTYIHIRAANCYDFGVAATLFNPDYAATLVTSMLRL